MEPQTPWQSARRCAVCLLGLLPLGLCLIACRPPTRPISSGPRVQVYILGYVGQNSDLSPDLAECLRRANVSSTRFAAFADAGLTDLRVIAVLSGSGVESARWCILERAPSERWKLITQTEPTPFSPRTVRVTVNGDHRRAELYDPVRKEPLRVIHTWTSAGD